MNEPARIRILSVDDHALVREGLATVINDQPDMQVVAEAATGGEAISQFLQWRPDVTLLDLRLPDMSGIEALAAIRREFPEARIIMLTTFEGDVEVKRALEAGARGYVFKSMAPESMFQVIRKVHTGKTHVPVEIAVHLAEHVSDEQLTRRELDVLEQMADPAETRSYRPDSRSRHRSSARYYSALVHTSKVVQKNISVASIDYAWQADILTRPCTCKVNTPDKEIPAATLVFCLSGRLGWHRLGTAEVRHRFHGGVAGRTMLGNQGRGGYSSCCRRPRGSCWHFAGNRISNPPC
jgi:DNA-binding NarL/FixJ family response regulator